MSAFVCLDGAALKELSDELLGCCCCLSEVSESCGLAQHGLLCLGWGLLLLHSSVGLLLACRGRLENVLVVLLALESL